MDLNVIDLFSGIGGFSLGLHNADPRFKTIAFCEIDPFCQKVLQKNFPGVKIYDDIKDFKNTEPAFLVCGGFPCQGFSQAGLRRGTKDDRYLWGEMFAVIKQVKSKWIIAENVRGIVTTQDGLAFDTVHSDLESENYEVRAFNLPACGKGAWHRRERIFFIAYTGNESGGTKTDVRNTQGAGFKSRTDGQRQEEPGGASPPGEQCQGDWSEIISQFRGVPDGVSTAVDRNRVNRLKALGNAVVPQIITELGKAIIKAEFNDG